MIVQLLIVEAAMGWLVAMEMMSLGTTRTTGGQGFLGQYGTVWSSCKQKGHLAMG